MDETLDETSEALLGGRIPIHHIRICTSRAIRQRDVVVNVKNKVQMRTTVPRNFE